MQNGIHFIAGLPRSGSTLLAALLRQNPRFHARMTSPMAGWFMAMQGAMSARNDTEVFVSDKQRRAALRGLFDAYYQDIHPDKVVFDSSRMWCAKLPALVDLFPAAKVICCVRNTGWIMDSMERLIRRNKFQLSKIYNFDISGTVYSRIAALAAPDGIFGSAWNAFKEAYYSEQADRLLVVTFDKLTRSPETVLEAIYAFTGEKPFVHDFNNVQYDEPEFDARIGTPGLHRIAGKIGYVERSTILPPELFARFEYDPFWINPTLNSRDVKVI